MQTFWHVVTLSIKRQLTYRTAILAGLVTNLAFGVMRVFMLIALYQGKDAVNGMTVQHAITFAALSQGMLATLRIFGSYDLMQLVYSGEIAADMLKPMSLFTHMMARDLGGSLVNLVARGILLMLIFSIFFDLSTPPSLITWPLLLLSMALSWLVNYAWRFLVNLASFWSPDARGIGRMGFGFTWLMSGFILPLRLFPEWFQRLCALTPFPSLLNTPNEIYLGLLDRSEIIGALLLQSFWLVVIVVLGQLILRAGVRRLVIQGG